MKGNDLDNSLTRRYYVTAEAVFDRVEEEAKKGRIRTVFTQRTLWMPDLAALSKLWRWSASGGVRLEVVFIGDLAKDAFPLWQMLEHGSANPFTDMQLFEDIDALIKILPYRPDLMGIVDIPQRAISFGGRGMTLEMLP